MKVKAAFNILLAHELPAVTQKLCTQAVATKVTLREGMALYGLTDAKLFVEKSCDTKLLMGWNTNTLLMAFRGTASTTAACYDLQVMRPCKACLCIAG